jgi:hypothetical protein
LKVFGDDAFGKVSSCCKVAAAVVTNIVLLCHSSSTHTLLFLPCFISYE